MVTTGFTLRPYESMLTTTMLYYITKENKQYR